MTKYVVLAALALFFSGCASGEIENSAISATRLAGGERMYSVDEQDRGSTITLTVGDYLSVVLEAQFSAGYQWELVNNSPLIKLVRFEEYPEGSAIPEPEQELDEMGQPRTGEPQPQQLLFLSVAEGTAELVLEYRSVVEDTSTTDTYSITVVIE